MDRMRMESIDMTAQNIDRIAALFPNCITEAIDAEQRLRGYEELFKSPSKNEVMSHG